MSGKPEPTGRKRTQFKPGKSGNPAGRPKGSRSKLGEDFLSALQQDFRDHGPDVIAKVREERPADYLKIVAGLLPRNVSINAPNPLENLSDEELTATLEAVRRIMAGDHDDGSDPATTTH